MMASRPDLQLSLLFLCLCKVKDLEPKEPTAWSISKVITRANAPRTALLDLLHAIDWLVLAPRGKGGHL